LVLGRFIGWSLIVAGNHKGDFARDNNLGIFARGFFLRSLIVGGSLITGVFVGRFGLARAGRLVRFRIGRVWFGIACGRFRGVICFRRGILGGDGFWFLVF
jgi:hypothetical protein